MTASIVAARGFRDQLVTTGSDSLDVEFRRVYTRFTQIDRLVPVAYLGASTGRISPACSRCRSTCRLTASPEAALLPPASS